MNVALEEKVNRVKKTKIYLKKRTKKLLVAQIKQFPVNSIYRLSCSRISMLLFSHAFTAIKS